MTAPRTAAERESYLRSKGIVVPDATTLEDTDEGERYCHNAGCTGEWIGSRRAPLVVRDGRVLCSDCARPIH
jgi:hypothetical protein